MHVEMEQLFDISGDKMMLINDHSVFFFQAEDVIRGLVRSRGLGDVYKRQQLTTPVVSL